MPWLGASRHKPVHTQLDLHSDGEGNAQAVPRFHGTA